MQNISVIFLLVSFTALKTCGQTASEAMPNYSIGSMHIITLPVSGTVGWAFQPLTDISVTALGAFAYNMPAGGLDVGLWDSSGLLLASNTITPGSSSVNFSLYEPVMPVMLAADQIYYLGAYSPSGPFVSDVVDPVDYPESGAAAMSPDILLEGIAAEHNSDFEFPDTIAQPPGSAIISPNFEFEDVPEPSTIYLFGAGSLVLLIARRSR